jgi:hypothetical protein
VSRFRKKPVVVEAVQWTGRNRDEVIAFLGDERRCVVPLDGPPNALAHVTIDTLEGRMFASAGDWIIRGVKGELYPCKPDIFAATYEAVEDGKETT